MFIYLGSVSSRHCQVWNYIHHYDGDGGDGDSGGDDCGDADSGGDDCGDADSGDSDSGDERGGDDGDDDGDGTVDRSMTIIQ